MLMNALSLGNGSASGLPSGDRRGIGEHADLHRADIKIGEHGIELRGDKIGGYVMNAEHALGVLRGERGDDGGAIDAERGKSLEIRLNPGATA